MTQQVNTATFEQQVLKSEVPVLVDFYATWCPPCQALAPRVDELAAELGGRAGVVKVNVDDDGDLASRYRITSVPTLILFDQGEQVGRWVGLQSKATLQAALDRRLAVAR
jgi:thioredoxin 1